MKNASRLAVLSLLAVVALTGCIRMNVDLTLQPDNTVDGTMVIAIQEGIGESLGMSDNEILEQITSDVGSDIEGGSQEPYKQDGYVGTKITFEGQSLEQAATDVGSDSLTITREGDTFIVDGPFDTGAEEAAEIPAGAEMTLSVTFPGAVTDHNGTLAGNTVTWDLTNPPANLHAVGGATTSEGTPTWVFILLAVVVILGLIAVIAWFAFRSRSQTLAGAEDSPATFSETVEFEQGTGYAAQTDLGGPPVNELDAAAPVDATIAGEVPAAEAVEPVAEPVAEPAADTVVEPAAESVSEPDEPAAEPAAEAAAAPAPKPARKPRAKPKPKAAPADEAPQEPDSK